MKRHSWDPRKERKARWKRSMARAQKRGERFYGGYVPFTDELLLTCTQLHIKAIDTLNREMLMKGTNLIFEEDENYG